MVLDAAVRLGCVIVSLEVLQVDEAAGRPPSSPCTPAAPDLAEAVKSAALDWASHVMSSVDASQGAPPTLSVQVRTWWKLKCLQEAEGGQGGWKKRLGWG